MLPLTKIFQRDRTPTIEEVLDEKYQDYLQRVKNGEIHSNRITPEWRLVPFNTLPINP